MQPERLLRQQPQPGRALYVDMNSFFAAVEQECNPDLRGKPVGVCPFVHDSTCIVAASIEAKRLGIRTGTSIRKARELYPDIILISDNTGAYRRYHHLIMDELRQTRCQVTVKSIDEALLVVPRDLRPQVTEIAAEVKRRITGVGGQLSCSVGIASNMFLAKMGTKLFKPNGLITINNEDLEALYGTLELTDLYGISWRTARRLHALGIETALDFYHAPFSQLQAAFGITGERWYLRLRGYEVDQLATTRHTIGHQVTIAPNPATSTAELLVIIGQLAHKAGLRLRSAELAATGIEVGLRFTDRSWWSRHRRHHEAFWDAGSFYEHAANLLEGYSPPKPVRLVSVTAYGLTPQNTLTRSLFDAHIRPEPLTDALDTIEHRFGRNTITPASHLLRTHVPDKVGFGNAGHNAKELPPLTE